MRIDPQPFVPAVRKPDAIERAMSGLRSAALSVVKVELPPDYADDCYVAIKGGKRTLAGVTAAVKRRSKSATAPRVSATLLRMVREGRLVQAGADRWELPDAQAALNRMADSVEINCETDC